MSESNPLVAYPDPAMPNMLKIKYQNGHPPPASLSGQYTSFTMVQRAIKAHEANKPKPIAYRGQKNITDEEEAALLKQVDAQVAEENAKAEADNGEEESKEIKNSADAEHLREGSDNGSESSDVPRERKPRRGKLRAKQGRESSEASGS